MTRLLFVDQYGEMGGGQRILMSLVRIAVTAGHRTTVLAPGGGALQAAISGSFGADVTFVPCEEPRLTHGRKGPGDVLKTLLYAWRFRRHRPLLASHDVIYVNGLRHLPHLLLLTQGLPARTIYHVHLVHSRIERLLLRMAARARSTFAVVANSRFVRDTLGFSGARITLIENALDPDFAKLPFADRFSGAGEWRAAVIGTLRPEKGQDIAVAAVETRDDWSLSLIGSTGDGAAAWVDALRKRASLKVNFRGAVTDIIQELDAQAVQVSIVPSRSAESFGLAAVESMACSCLTIVSGRGGLTEIAENTGAWVASDGESLSRLLDEIILLTPSELAALARGQHARTLAHYGPERFEAQITALLAKAASAPAARR